MSRLKGFVEDWLEEYGYELGYSWDSLPSINDLDEIVVNKITYVEYVERRKSK